MNLFAAAGLTALLGGFLSFALRKRAGIAAALGAGGTILGAVIASVPVLAVLGGHAAFHSVLPWSVPFGSFSVEMDALSAWFLVPVVVLAVATALDGLGSDPGSAERSGAPWLFFTLLVVSMSVVLVARNGMLFLFGWEGMALASFVLVTTDDEKRSVRQAGWIYLALSQIGTACLLAFFVLLSRRTGSMDMQSWLPQSGDVSGNTALFLLALVGFGTKAGLVPLHVWLPKAHPVAPSHVSALMSGVMIKMGIFGLIRFLPFVGAPPLWWAWTLIAVGAVSALFGVLYAITQADVKKILAYSSVENVGIITLGVGIGFFGLAVHSPAIFALGMGGALLHVWNHALYKGLLFLGAGAILHGTGIRQLDRLGGLIKRMPGTAALVLVGAVAISGVPPLNGFASEFLILLAVLRGVLVADPLSAASMLAVLAVLALVGALSVACFTKFFAIGFLGTARSEGAAHAHESNRLTRAAMGLLAGSCALAAIGCPFLLMPLLSRALLAVGRISSGSLDVPLADAAVALSAVMLLSLGALILALQIAWIRQRHLAKNGVDTAGTWDCGYARPSPRMQYTASSFTRDLSVLFSRFAPIDRDLVLSKELSRDAATLTTRSPDVFEQRLFRPLYARLRQAFSTLRWIQHGRLHLYVLYVGLTLLFLLLWNLR